MVKLFSLLYFNVFWYVFFMYIYIRLENWVFLCVNRYAFLCLYMYAFLCVYVYAFLYILGSSMYFNKNAVLGILVRETGYITFFANQLFNSVNKTFYISAIFHQRTNQLRLSPRITLKPPTLILEQKLKQQKQ